MNSPALNIAQAPAPSPPRAIGAMALSSKARDGHSVIDGLRTSGSMRLLFPRTQADIEAIAINTSGGLTGGDRFSARATAGAGSTLVLTTQAAERAYRAAAGRAKVRTHLTVAKDARLCWLPQELIVFDGAALERSLTIDMAPTGRLLMVEPMIFGRSAMGERLNQVTLSDRIEIMRAGRPLYLDALHLAGDLEAQLARPALARGARAMASIVMVDPRAEAALDSVRHLLPAMGGASLLAPDVLVVRLLGSDGFALRQSLVPILEILRGAALPRSWSL